MDNTVEWGHFPTWNSVDVEFIDDDNNYARQFDVNDIAYVWAGPIMYMPFMVNVSQWMTG